MTNVPKNRHRAAAGWALACLVYLVWNSTTFAATPPPVASPARTVREFYSYLAASDYRTTAGPDNHWVEAPNIRDDEAAQGRWLSRALRESLRRANASIRRHHSRRGEIPVPEFDSGAFRFAWDPPGQFEITRTIRAPFSAIVAGMMVWGPKQQYAGNRRNAYFILVAEDGAWRVDDIQVEPYEFDRSTSSLREQLAAYW